MSDRTPAPWRATSLARELAGDWLARASARSIATNGPQLVGLTGAAVGRRYVLVARVEPAPAGVSEERSRGWSIGRAPTCDIVIIDPDLSRAHARITRQGDRFFLRDLGSKNGTRVAGLALPSGTLTQLRDGDDVELGGCTLRFVHRAARFAAMLAGPTADPPVAAGGRDARPDPARPANAGRDASGAPVWARLLAQLLAGSIATVAGTALVAMFW